MQPINKSEQYGVEFEPDRVEFKAAAKTKLYPIELYSSITLRLKAYEMVYQRLEAFRNYI